MKNEPHKMRRHLEMLKNIIQSHYCCLVDLKYSEDYTDEVMAIISGQLHNLCSALALIVTSEIKDAGAAKFLNDYPYRQIPVKPFVPMLNAVAECLPVPPKLAFAVHVKLPKSS